ncbi:hypothetical protein FRC05_009709 [Tulasnella sp. 425]|nr:hypothetical protein FRC05_009709 [Tulasnella sp. 425]
MALEESSRYWALRDVLKVMRFTVAQGATQAIGRFGVIVCLLVLPSPFGPRSNKRSSRAHLAPFTTIIVAILFALGLASLTLSIYLSFALSTPLRILSITQPSFLFTTLLLTLVTFALLFALFNFAAAISRPDQNRGSFAEDFLASKATQHSVRPSSTATSPLLASSVVFTTRLPSSGSLLESSPSRSWVWSEPVSNLTLANRRLDRDMLDVVHIGLSIGRAVCEVAWVGRVVQIFYATPTFPVASKSALHDGIPPGSTESGSPSCHLNHHVSVANTNGGILTLPPSYSTRIALEGGGSVGGSITYFATLSEELLALRTVDPVRRRGVVVAKTKAEACPATAAVYMSAKPKTKARPRRSSTSGSLSDVLKDSDESDLAAPDSSRGPSSKKARTRRRGMRRRSGGVGKVKKEVPAEATNNRVPHFGDLPSLVLGATRPRPPRNLIPRLSQQIDTPGPLTRGPAREEGVNSLGLIVDDRQSMPRLPPPGLEDAHNLTFIAFNATAAEYDDGNPSRRTLWA